MQSISSHNFTFSSQKNNYLCKVFKSFVKKKTSLNDKDRKCIKIFQNGKSTEKH